MKYRELIDLAPEIEQVKDPLQKEELRAVLGLGIDFYWKADDEVVNKILKAIKLKLTHHKNETIEEMSPLLRPDANLQKEAQD